MAPLIIRSRMETSKRITFSRKPQAEIIRCASRIPVNPFSKKTSGQLDTTHPHSPGEPSRHHTNAPYYCPVPALRANRSRGLPGNGDGIDQVAILFGNNRPVIFS